MPISELTPTMVLNRGRRRTRRGQAEFIVRMHTQRLLDPYIREDARRNLEHELELAKQKLTQI